MPSKHLPLIQQAFPGKLILNIEEIATLIDTTSNGIYAMIRDNDLPFRLIGKSRKIQALAVDIATYLDNLYEKLESKDAEEKIGVIQHKRRGRPRKTYPNEISTVRAFQVELSFAISQHKSKTILNEIEEKLTAIQFIDDDRECYEKFNENKAEMESAISKAYTQIEVFSLDFFLEEKEEEVKKDRKILKI